jgi:hypothetical protein
MLLRILVICRFSTTSALNDSAFSRRNTLSRWARARSPAQSKSANLRKRLKGMTHDRHPESNWHLVDLCRRVVRYARLGTTRAR